MTQQPAPVLLPDQGRRQLPALFSASRTALHAL